MIIRDEMPRLIDRLVVESILIPAMSLIFAFLIFSGLSYFQTQAVVFVIIAIILAILETQFFATSSTFEASSLLRKRYRAAGLVLMWVITVLASPREYNSTFALTIFVFAAAVLLWWLYSDDRVSRA